MQSISSSDSKERPACIKRRVMSRRTGKSCSFCTALARFCSRCTVAFDIARNNRAKRVCRALCPVRPAITVHFEQSRTQDGSRQTRIDSPPACPASAPVSHPAWMCRGTVLFDKAGCVKENRPPPDTPRHKKIAGTFRHRRWQLWWSLGGSNP